MNRVTLLGHVGQDPTYTQNDKVTVCNFSMATSEGYKDKQGEWVNKTEWHRIVFFGKSATRVSNILKKGTKVLVEGKITTRKWQDRDGNDKYTTEVIGRFFDTFIPKDDTLSTQNAEGYHEMHKQSASMHDDDLPF